ncbi:hypothetical protein [Stratiformator vulcanicus]|uniref:Uncharacterized protein n=1 Tax=Stratiformator vulcanicus TaxID=2527980 RepID=A0A517QWR3_9PLAN|nr:hypothetical protein [Stratiformator vulcanicus]QDT36106.1 hypothetical protein Pan189_04610 [Stratiformator vulcanicus]
MPDLEDLSSVNGADLTEAQIKGILAQIDLDITNLLRDGKLAALKYSLPGDAGRAGDRAANLHALLDARRYYSELLKQQPAIHAATANFED